MQKLSKKDLDQIKSDQMTEPHGILYGNQLQPGSYKELSLFCWKRMAVMTATSLSLPASCQKPRSASPSMSDFIHHQRIAAMAYLQTAPCPVPQYQQNRLYSTLQAFDNAMNLLRKAKPIESFD
eukprot:s123_g47.t1